MSVDIFSSFWSEVPSRVELKSGVICSRSVRRTVVVGWVQRRACEQPVHKVCLPLLPTRVLFLQSDCDSLRTRRVGSTASQEQTKKVLQSFVVIQLPACVHAFLAVVV